MKLLITGANGFIGRNLVVWLRHLSGYEVIEFNRTHTEAYLVSAVAEAEAIIHLAGVNRPPNETEFQTINVDLTNQLCQLALATGRAIPILFASSTQAELANPYGASKRQAELVLTDYAQQCGASVIIFRLTNIFGKWSRPNYNSVVATFCHNIAHNLPIAISDRERSIEFVHVDDVIRCFLAELKSLEPNRVQYREATPTHTASLGYLADMLHHFRQSRQTLRVPDLSDPFSQQLYSTFLSYLAPDDFAYDLVKHTDLRGSLAEFVKSPSFGQIFVSRTKPGVTRGNHFHHLKTEKFLVLEGQAIVRFRHVQSDEVIEYPVDGEAYRVVDIPPGYTHSIENVGKGILVTLFWASEIFDPTRPDTVWEEVLT